MRVHCFRDAPAEISRASSFLVCAMRLKWCVRQGQTCKARRLADIRLMPGSYTGSEQPPESCSTRKRYTQQTFCLNNYFADCELPGITLGWESVAATRQSSSRRGPCRSRNKLLFLWNALPWLPLHRTVPIAHQRQGHRALALGRGRLLAALGSISNLPAMMQFNPDPFLRHHPDGACERARRRRRRPTFRTITSMCRQNTAIWNVCVAKPRRTIARLVRFGVAKVLPKLWPLLGRQLLSSKVVFKLTLLDQAASGGDLEPAEPC